jgi:hypothetical protein
MSYCCRRCTDQVVEVDSLTGTTFKSVPAHPLCRASIACSQNCTDTDLAPPWPTDGSVPRAHCYQPSPYFSDIYYYCASDFGYVSAEGLMAYVSDFPSYCDQGFFNRSFDVCVKRFGCDHNCRDIILRWPASVNPGSVQALIPWNWTMDGLDGHGARKCPSTSRILGMFAAVNIASTVLSVIVGGDGVVRSLCCRPNRIYSRDEPSKESIAWRWIMPVALQLTANAIIAVLIKATPGYGGNFSILELTIFYAARPRMSWFVLVWLGMDKTFRRTAMAQAGAEVCLQVIAAYTMGRTASYGVGHGWLVIGRLNGSLGDDAQLMYSGSLFYMVTGSIGTIAGIYWLLKTCTGELGVEDDIQEDVVGLALFLVPILLIFNWLGAWLFWAGFVKVAGDL